MTKPMKTEIIKRKPQKAKPALREGKFLLAFSIGPAVDLAALDDYMKPRLAP
jgi:hypothetical protein